MTSTPDSIDERLLAASDLARAALLEVTSEASVGDPVGYIDEGDGVVSLRFANRLAGYPGWFWTVSVARVEDAEPTVLEVELLPGDDALLAPEWTPWAVRLAEYQAAQTALAEAADAAGEDADIDDEDDEDESDDDLDDDEIDDVLGDDDDDDELDEDGSPILHAGDLDGVDIDQLDPSAPDDDEDDLDSDDDSEEDVDDDDSDEDLDDSADSADSER